MLACDLNTQEVKTTGSGVQDKLWLHREFETELHKVLSEKQNSYQNTIYYSIVHNKLLWIDENLVKRRLEAPTTKKREMLIALIC